MKAYKVTAKNHDISIVVFAKNSNESKIIAMGNEWFEDEEYIEMIAVREKWADEFYNGDYFLDFCKHSNLFHKHDWCCFNVVECDEPGCVFRMEYLELDRF